MKSRSPGFYLSVLLLWLAIFHMIYSYPLLADRVATHFNAAGRPNGWMTRDCFIAFYAGTVLLTTAVFGFFSLLLPKMPTRMINLPYRDYWLGPERRQASLVYLTEWMQQMGCATLAFLIGLMHQVVCFNIEQQKTLTQGSWALLAAYLFFTFVWVVRLYVRFRKPQ